LSKGLEGKSSPSNEIMDSWTTPFNTDFPRTSSQISGRYLKMKKWKCIPSLDHRVYTNGFYLKRKEGERHLDMQVKQKQILIWRIIEN
jgi:hypothetical protein